MLQADVCSSLFLRRWLCVDSSALFPFNVFIFLRWLQFTSLAVPATWERIIIIYDWPPNVTIAGVSEVCFNYSQLGAGGCPQKPWHGIVNNEHHCSWIGVHLGDLICQGCICSGSSCPWRHFTIRDLVKYWGVLLVGALTSCTLSSLPGRAREREIMTQAC